MGSLLLMSQICTVLAMVLNAYAMSWFDFQNKCRLLGQEMPSATYYEKPYWTKYYKRQSDWIGKYGCYNKTDLEETATFHIHLPSAGLCQEFCMENNKSNELFFFGVQERNCICLSVYPPVSSKPLNQCEFACFINNVSNESLKCRESSVYSVFVSKKDRRDIICNDSDANCCKEDQGQIYKDETKCNSVNEHYQDKCVINLTTQIYTSFDRGKELSISYKTNILFCQQCTEKGCPFINCTSHLNITNCAQNVLSTAQPSVLKTITQTVVPNATEKRVITLNKHVSRYTKQTLVHGANVSRTTQPTSKQDTITISRFKNPTLLHEANISRTTQPTSKDDTSTITNDSMTFIVGGLASSTVICFLFLMVAIYFIIRKHRPVEKKYPTLQKQIECSRFRYEQTSIAKLNPQNKQGHQNVTGTSYYELADNSKLRETNSKNKDHKNPYNDIKEPVSGNDIYMVASYKTLDGDSVKFDRKKGSYNYLRETSRFRHEENMYDHAGNIDESSYSCAEAARKWNDRHIDNDLYDHI